MSMIDSVIQVRMELVKSLNEAVKSVSKATAGTKDYWNKVACVRLAQDRVEGFDELMKAKAK